MFLVLKALKETSPVADYVLKIKYGRAELINNAPLHALSDVKHENTNDNSVSCQCRVSC